MRLILAALGLAVMCLVQLALVVIWLVQLAAWKIGTLADERNLAIDFEEDPCPTPPPPITVNW